MGMSADQYREQLQALLPSGAAWPRDAGAVLTATLDALAQEFGRVDARMHNLRDEADPRTAVELLPDYERVHGLPDPCVTDTLTADQRRNALVSKMTSLGGQSPAYFLAVLQRLGYVSSRWTRLAWHFIGAVQGWTVANATLTPGTTSATLLATAADPILRRTIKACAGSKYRYVVVRFRRLVAGTWEGSVQYVTPAHGESASYAKTIAEPAEWSTGAWAIVAWDMHALTAGGNDWLNSFITGLRLDFSSANGSSVEIDWIALSEYSNPDLAVTIDEQVDGLPHRWRVNAAETTVTEATCMSPCTTPLRVWGNQPLQCAMNRLKPAHTDLLFSFLNEA
jgi:uncharacterized protein YmfQ (DUF2313 family)